MELFTKWKTMIALLFFKNHGFSNVAKSEKKDILISTLQVSKGILQYPHTTRLSYLKI